MRSISHSEAQTLLDCAAKHDFAYVGRLAGSCLVPKVAPIRLREGRAWCRAVGILQANDDPFYPGNGLYDARAELLVALDEDAAEQVEAGVYDEAAHSELSAHLGDILDHYAAEWQPLLVDRLEHELEVPIPSRRGRRSSNMYRLLCRLDGVHTDEHGEWIVENKLRGELSDLRMVTLQRQIRWYAWAWRATTGRSPVGVIVEERLNEAPRPAKVNKDGRPSSDKRQMTTPHLYREACQLSGFDPDPETLEAFAARRWQARHRVFLTEAEIDEVGQQLVSVARQVHLMETGDLFPVRNPAPYRCRGCQFLDVCNTPCDAELVDALFTRVPAKRDRIKEMIP